MGPLHGFKILEIAGIGPGQFCGMLLADMGADVIRLARSQDDTSGISVPPRFNLMNRSRTTLHADLKTERGKQLVLRLCEEADALFEGFRPGVMERLGLGPGECMARNPKLVYGRMTGWGQDGPLAKASGHDANYIALSGALASIGEKGGPPIYPLNLVGDFGGGGLYLAMGILAALLEAGRSGMGQVIDAAMVDGAASLMTVFHGLAACGMWNGNRGSNILDGGAPFVRPYRTSDDQYIVVSPLEGPFFEELLELLQVDDLDPARQYDPAYWPVIEKRLEQVFAGATRAQWCALLEGTDACFAPVLELAEVAQHSHNRARGNMVEVDGIEQPAPAPRFSRTPSEIHCPAGEQESAEKILERWGLSSSRVNDGGACG